MFFELLKSIIPPILTGIIGFAIAKINRNIPLDKLEITYNRVYYPIYKLLKEFDEVGEIDHVKLQTLYKLLKLKYDKYLSPGTKYLFNCYDKSLEKNLIDRDKNYQKLHDNIVRTNGYIRCKLGYLTTNYYDALKIMPRVQKWLFFDAIFLSITYILIIISSAIHNDTLTTITNLFAIFTLLSLFTSLCLFLSDVVKGRIVKK